MLGRLITFEGIDGSGKSTQIRRAEEYLRSRGVDVCVLQEPGGTPVGDAIRDILLHGQHQASSLKSQVSSIKNQQPVTSNRQPETSNLSPMTELLLFEASRAELVAQVIRPLFDAGTTILLDRFTDSTLAYQGYGRGIDLDVIRKMNDAATGGLTPDLTLLFSLPVDVSLARLTGVNDRIERLGPEFFQRVREGFLKLAESAPMRWRVIDGAGKTDEVWETVAAAIESFGKNED